MGLINSKNTTGDADQTEEEILALAKKEREQTITNIKTVIAKNWDYHMPVAKNFLLIFC